mmetsp:Transcript_2629/g.5665  ORF Transcript_2629/g.5665 Transcript_2629/m.5665 type:complete len:1261 (-) Transcript_2629:59-3841(-)
MNAPSFSQLGLKLTAIPRPSETDRGNLFVRLTPRTAWRLASLLLSSSPSHDDAQRDIFDVSQEVPDIDFLPLEIVIHQRGPRDSDIIEDAVGGNNITVYASYNGGAPSSGVGSMNNEDIIELPFDLHPSLLSVFNSTSEPILVSVRPVSDAPIAERVTFEPLTVSDWEMIEMEACMLEDGGLLNQITIVSPGQVFPLRFGGHSLESAAWIKVVDEDFGTSLNQKMDDDNSDESDASFTSDSDFDSSTDSSDDEDDTPTSIVGIHRHGCLRLMAETEVAVIPKPRIRKEEQIENQKSNEHPSNDAPIYCPSTPLRVQPISSDVSHSDSLAEESPPLPNPLLGSVCVHPATLIQIPGYQQCIEAQCQYDQNDDLTVELPPMVVAIRKVSRPYAKYSSQYKAEHGKGTGSDAVIAIIHASNCTREGHIGMHDLLRHQLGVSPLADWISVQVWSESYVVNSLNGVRDGTERIQFEKVSMVTPQCSSALYPWKFPDGYRTVASPTSEMVHYTCECCREHTLGNGDNTTRDDNMCNPLPVFSSGSLIPAEFLRSLGLDWPDQHCPDMFILKLNPIIAPLEDSIKRSACLPTSTSRLVPIVTARDLKERVMSDIKFGKEDTDNKKLLESLDYTLMMPKSDQSTVGFTSAIQSVIRSARQITSSPPRNEADPIALASQSMHNHAVMITGEEGSGKTHLSITSASQLSTSDLFATVYLDCKKLQATSSNIQIILEEIQKSFQEAVYKQPSMLVLDDLDALIPNVGSSDAEGDGSIHHHQLNPALVIQVKIIVDHLLLQSRYCYRSFRQKSSTKSTGVTLVCTCHDKDSLSIRYQGSGVFHSSVEVPSLDSSQRSQFLHNNVFGNTLVVSNDRIPHAISRLGKDTDGFRPKDLKIVSTRIVQSDCLRNFHSQLSELNSKSTTPDEAQQSSFKTLELDIASIIEDYAPLSQQLVDIDHNTCSIDWSSVGGLYKAKQSLHDIIIHPMKFKSVYDSAPMALPTGILLYGPPGNGKSFIVPLLAKTSKLNLITCRGPELLDRYIGASEAKVRQLFARATAAAPSVIFFDEFDSLAPQRGSDNTGVTDRVVNQLLTLLDGAERSKKAEHIFVVAATSRPDKIDKALLRPGRLEKHVYVGYPGSLLEWNSLFSSLLKTRNVDEEVSHLQQGGDLFSFFCKDFGYAKDFSAADMKAVLDTAHLLCVHDILDANQGGARGPPILGKCHILEAFRRTRPSLLPKDRRVLQSIYDSFGSNQTKEESSENPSGQKLKTSLR